MQTKEQRAAAAKIFKKRLRQTQIRIALAKLTPYEKKLLRLTRYEEKVSRHFAAQEYRREGLYCV